tara:strand:+ start:659 stop:844 length:186 start_codon:yes stop_codon:yes gene_type:complete
MDLYMPTQKNHDFSGQTTIGVSKKTSMRLMINKNKAGFRSVERLLTVMLDCWEGAGEIEDE